ncbi:carbon-nitrogen hydrolase family protein [Rhizobium rhizogenes]|jgi:aliphatic nitrilase|uniref:Carbon-nitrogen hydrolase family protein n=1 Tax=Rhizobium rhizogenes TaxID=359 RepID=A0AA94V8Q4_RHIRH|nr:carbon-nitrogen hydrolase family protein [Rhizobium rhizogenes]NSY62247.1 carbon-nitrogen hydrolase family protein [Agrobacterium tumefaciens]TRA84549.1 carbon-nitrogen hydrolase family protein [Rhizobium rhizogenes]UXT84475.1 carbon-nitrogen hydrolase family protein [Agrobacterium tumefaciens]
MKNYPSFKAASCHISSVYFDQDACVEKACAWIAEAARNGAELVAFPEAFISAFPVWAGVWAPVDTHEFFAKFAASAVAIDGPEMLRIRRAAKQHGVFVSIGINEATPNSVGCVWDTNVLIGDDGSILNRHRKLMPTHFEKLVWAMGDGSGLRVVDTRIGRIGALICGENTNSLARFALMSQGENVHISSFSPRFPTHPLGQSAYDLEASIRLRAGAHAFEAKLFNIVSSSFLQPDVIEMLSRGNKTVHDTIDQASRSVSMILGPDGAPISDVIRDSEGIAYADIDIAKCVVPKQFQDVVGYYNRFDVFTLGVNRAALRPASFTNSDSSGDYGDASWKGVPEFDSAA